MREPTKMGRPREFDVNEALAAIMDVFWTKGFAGASMRDLVGATGLKKGSLYAAFVDKRAMYHKALAFYDRTRIDSTVRGLKSGGPPITRIDPPNQRRRHLSQRGRHHPIDRRHPLGAERRMGGPEGALHDPGNNHTDE